MATRFILSWIFFLLCIAFFQSSNAAYNVVNFGARPDGKTDSTLPFLKAWLSACNSVIPATLYVPRGRFLLKPIVFSGPCKSKIVFQIAGTLVAPSDYWSLGNSGNWILFNKVNRVAIYGGNLDAKGAGYWSCRRAGRSCPAGSTVCYGLLLNPKKKWTLLSLCKIINNSNSVSCWFQCRNIQLLIA